MSGKYTNTLQAAVLFEGDAPVYPSIALNPFRMAMLERNLPLNVAQESETSALLLGPGELYISVAYYDHPADHAVFANTLRSGMTRLLLEDASDRVQRHRSHMLIEVWHGVLAGAADNPEVAGFLDKIGMPKPGHSQGEFDQRIEVLGEACRHIMNAQPASAVHWTQSNMLIAGEKFAAFHDQPRPSLLTVHPITYGGEPVAGFDEHPVGMLTLGAADYIGREIHVEPAPLPWFELYESALAFIRVAIQPGGYIIPDSDTFGVETGEFSYRVRHLEGAETVSPDGAPCYQLTLLFSKEHGYTAPDYERGPLVRGGIDEAEAILGAQAGEYTDLIEEWRSKERMAAQAGGSFELYQPPETGGESGPDDSGSSGGQPVFGKRKTLH